MLNTELNGLIMSAMKSTDKVRLNALKSIKTAFVTWTQAKENVGKELTESVEISILRKLKAQYEDAASLCNDGHHDELVTENTALAKIIDEFLPAPVTEDVILKEVENVVSSQGLEPDKKNMGKIINAVKTSLPGADAKVVSNIVLKYILSKNV